MHETEHSYTPVEQTERDIEYEDDDSSDSLMGDPEKMQGDLDEMLDGEYYDAAARYMTQILDNDNEDELIEETAAWRIAGSFLDRLLEIEGKEENKIERYEVVRALERSLTITRIDEHNAPAFIHGIEALKKSGGYDTRIGNLILKHHHDIRQINNEKLQVSYNLLLQNPDTIRRLGNIFTDDNSQLDGDLIDEGYMLYRDLLTNLGFEHIEDCLRSLGIHPARGLKHIAELEEERQGAARLLNTFYGIRNFGRSHPDALSTQVNSHEILDGQEYGTTIGAVEDDTRALALGWRDTESFTASDLSVRTRGIEVSSRTELAERLSALEARFGSKKIAFAYVSAHGTGKSLILDSQYGDEGKLSVGDDLSSFRTVFIDNPTFVLGVCSAGQEGGIAQYISQELNAIVVAPLLDAGVESLTVTQRGGNLHIVPAFATENPHKEDRTPVEAVLYIGGERIYPTDERYRAYFDSKSLVQG